MAETTIDAPKATKTRRVIDVRIVIDPPSYLGRCIRKLYDTPEYWAELRKEYQGWVNEFREFLRDHRSQDANIMSVDEDVIDACSVCGDAWEPWDDDGTLCCASCGAEIEVNNVPAACAAN